MTDPAKAIEIPMHIDSTPAVASFNNLLRDQCEVNNVTNPSMKLKADVSSLRTMFKISRVAAHRA